MLELEQRYRTLNDKQREAVDTVIHHSQNTLVIAGPGSGKTRIISTSAAKLYEQQKSVACLSFSNAAVESIRVQMNRMDIFETSEVFIGTIHDFCLTKIIYPFVHIIDCEIPREFSIASPEQTKQIERNLKPSSVQRNRTIQKIRRDLVSEGINTLKSDEYKFLLEYDAEMFSRNLLDFEIILQQAIKFIEKSSVVRSHIQQSFEWIFVDEYQDMGGSLHKLVTLLLEKTQIKFMLVGDPNQMIYQWHGAKREFLEQIYKRSDFKLVMTDICYRFSDKLVAATTAILQANKLSYKSASNSNGDLYYIGNMSKTAQIQFIYDDLLPSLKSTDFASIAVLCRFKSPKIDSFYEDLYRASISSTSNESFEIIREKGFLNLPDSPFIEWLGECSNWQLNADHNIVNRLSNLVDFYVSLMKSNGDLLSGYDIAYLEDRFIKVLQNINRDTHTIKSWLNEFGTAFQLGEILRGSVKNSSYWFEIKYLWQSNEINCRPIQEFSLRKQSQGIILTTINASKGREFDYVILPMIQDGIIPHWIDKGKSIDELQNLLYVGTTRAKRSVFILSQQSATKLPRLLRNNPYLNFNFKSTF